MMVILPFKFKIEKEMGKSIDVMDCFIGALLDNKQLNVSLIDLAWENSIDASVTFATHCVCVCVCVTYMTCLGKPEYSIM